MRAINHEIRAKLVQETHARPTLPAPGTCIVRHQALLHSDGGAAARKVLASLCAALGTAPPAERANHHIATTEDGVLLKWERHGEFNSWMVICPGDGSAMPRVLIDTEIPGQQIAAVNVTVVEEAEPISVTGTQSPLTARDWVEQAGGLVCSGRAAVWTDLMPNEQGLVRYEVRQHGLGPKRLGRLIRRITEIETYRMTAMLAFPLAGELRPELDKLDLAVRAAMEDNKAEEEQILDVLSSAARDTERLSARTDFRFGAAKAYRAIVEKRLGELSEGRIEGYQRLATFLGRRFLPAMETIDATSRRIEGLSARIERASSLLRTRVDLERQRQNQRLLESMNERATLQLRLQETVEGLSVVAISYYAFSLLQKVVTGVMKPLLSQAGISVAVFDALLAVFVVTAVWIALRQVRKRIGSRADAAKLPDL